MFFPDVNVLVALTIDSHQHSPVATSWYAGQGKPTLAVCRHTQLGMLRFITSKKFFGESAVTNQAAFGIYDQLISAGRLEFWLEPSDLEPLMRSRADIPTQSPNVWSDAYLEGFAIAARLQLVTFDVSLARHTPRSILLKP